MFHPSVAARDLDMQREGSRGQAKRSFLSDVVSFLSRIFSFFVQPARFVYPFCGNSRFTEKKYNKAFLLIFWGDGGYFPNS